MTVLLNVDDAIAQILNQVPDSTCETLKPQASLGRVLCESVTAGVDLPPFANSAMDGFAVRATDIQMPPQTLRVTMDIPAGTAPQSTVQPGEAARIMTGAPVPDGADAVVPVEDTNVDWSTTDALPATVEIRSSVSVGDNIRPIGENVKKGAPILAKNTVLRPQDIGILAALGTPHVSVYEKPLVAVLSTGDELVDIDEPIAPGQIRDTNRYTIAGMAHTNGAEVVAFPAAADSHEAVHALFQSALALQPDLVVSTAGVSVGKHDVVRSVVEELGKLDFWRVNVRPGKPLAFGQVRGVPFFGLPGNPVSAMITFEVFVLPALLKLAGRPDTTQVRTAITGEDMTSDGRRTFVRVKLSREGNTLKATTTGTQSSGALMSMVLADGLLVIPEGTQHVAAGTELPVRLLREV